MNLIAFLAIYLASFLTGAANSSCCEKACNLPCCETCPLCVDCECPPGCCAGCVSCGGAAQTVASGEKSCCELK
ncbi:MAG: hypothetical protein SFU86_12100 [Pirellulaceae bacterium]|nr:hypothetical protein [Pirellulaceae bacterium]